MVCQAGQHDQARPWVLLPLVLVLLALLPLVADQLLS
jgi:hypothetical protein